MFLASLLAMPMPLMPIQILWVNLITDGLPAMALGVEPPEPGIMERQPRLKSEGIFARGLGWTVCGRGLYIALATLTVFTIGLIYSRWQGISGLETARTMALSTLVFSQLFYVFECRSETHSPFELGFTSNPFLSAAVVCSALMHLAVVYLPVMQNIFGTVNLGLWQWLLIISVSGIKLLWKYMQYTWRRIFVSSFRYGKINA
nr:cation-translocating P-type ATPase C-terminal domain-containing protein [Syntrophomonas palmitatica]